MLGTYPNAATTQSIFPSRNFPNLQFLKSLLAAELGLYSILASALGPHAHPSPSAWLPFQPAGRQKAKYNLWEVAIWEIVIWEVAFGKMPWENA